MELSKKNDALQNLKTQITDTDAEIKGIMEEIDRVEENQGIELADGGDGKKQDAQLKVLQEGLSRMGNKLIVLKKRARALENEITDLREALDSAQKKARAQTNEQLFLAMLRPCLDFARTSKEFIFDCRSLGGVGGVLGRPALPWEQLMQLFNQDDHTLRAIKKYIADHDLKK